MHLVVVITHYANVLFAIRTTDENYIEQQRFLVVLIVFGNDNIMCLHVGVFIFTMSFVTNVLQ